MYETKKTDSTTLKDEVWEVRIKNVGLGAAVINGYMFRLSLNAVINDDYKMSFQEIVKEFKLNNLILGRDYQLINITKGFILSSKDEKVIFEVKLPQGYSIKQFDLKINLEGFLGGKYVKQIYLLPRLGIPTIPVIELTT